MRGATHAGWTAGAAAVALAATACAGAQGGEGSGGGGTGIVSSSWGDPQNPLEPANTNEVQGGKVLDMIFRGLKRYDARTGEAEDMLAQKIETSDSRNFTVTVKDGWTFSNGEAVSAKSFVDAWNYGASLKHHQRNAYFFGYIEGSDKVHPEGGGKQSADTLSGLKVTGERTFTVRLNQKFSSFPDTLGYAAFSPLPRAFFDNHALWLKKPVGNGPYIVDSYTKGSQMSLRKRDDYPGDDRAENDGVDLKVYTDNNTAYTDLMAGNLDLVDDVPASQLKNVRSDLGDRYINQPAGIIQTLAFPFYDKAWKKDGMAKVRKGLSMAIDREQITETLFQKTRTPATDWTSPVLGEDGYRTGLCGEACEYNAAEAKRLIKEGGGLPGGQIKITYNADTGSHREWVDAVCNSINNALDNDRACAGNPMGTFADYRNQITRSKLSGPFRAGWQMDYPLIQNFLQPLYYTNASSNDGKWSNAEFDRLVDEANAETDPAKAVKLFQQAEEVLRDDMGAIPLWYQNGSAGYSERLSDVTLNQFSVPDYHQIKDN